MAQKVLVQLVDDLDGTNADDISTVLFGLDGVEYEIDLTEDNADTLRDVLAPFVESGRRTGGRIKRSTRSNGSAQHSSEAGKIREWAMENGYELSGRGRIPNHVTEAYEEAKTAPANPRASKSRRRTTKK